MNKVLQFIIDNWKTGLQLSPFLYEIVVRLWPTKWNLSILDNLWKILNFIIPNVRKPDGNEVIPSQQGELSFDDNGKASLKKKGFLKNLVKVAVNRFVLKCVILVMIAGSANAQIWQTYKGVRFNGLTDTSTVNQQPSVYYNPNTGRLMGKDATGFFNLRAAGSGSGTVTSVTGTTDRITVATGTTTPVINIAPTYAGQNTITNVGTLTAGATGVGFTMNFTNSTKIGLIPIANGGTNLSSLGSALQVLRVNSGATALEYATLFSPALGAATQIPFMNGGATNYSYNSEFTYQAGNRMTTAPLLDLGISTTAGSIRNISAVGSAANIGMIIESKGTGDFELRATGGGNILLEMQGAVNHRFAPTSFTAGTFDDFTFTTHDGSGASTPSYDLKITTGNATGPGAAASGLTYITSGIAFGAKPGNVLIAGGSNTTGDDSGDVILSAAQYTGDSATVSVTSSGTIEMRTHGDVVVRPNSLTTVASFSLDHTKFLSNDISGTAVLVAGTATVTYDYIPGDIIMLTVQQAGGTQGFLSIDNAGGGTFDIVSTSATETSTVGWFVVSHF